MVTTSGGAKCWGTNAFGYLGDGTTTNRTIPTNVVGLATGVAGISAGGRHTCASTLVGGLKCWGLNSNGELGIGASAARLLAVDVPDHLLR